MVPRALRQRTLWVLALLVAGSSLAGCGPLLDPGAFQERATEPAPRLVAGRSLSQSFVASRDRLAAVDVLVAVYASPAAGAGELVLRLRAEGEETSDLGVLRLPLAGLANSSRQRLNVAVQDRSAGRGYRVVVETTANSPAAATVWRTADDAYPDGALALDGQPLAGDLAFRAYYDYSPLQLASDLLAAAPTGAWPLVVALALVLLPGFAVERLLLRGMRLDLAEAAGMWLGLSLAFWPGLLLAITLAGGRLEAWSAALLLALGAVAGMGGCLAGSGWPGRRAHALGAARGALFTPACGAFLVCALALGLRFLHARDLALPMWVDSVHHTLIAGLIAQEGRVPLDYGPLLSGQPFTYHYGFHVPVAVLSRLTGMEAADAVLLLGQLLGGLVVLGTYLLGSRLSGERAVGLVAGLVVGLLATMPAYYVSWGRYTQLAGLAALPAAAVLTAALWDGKSYRRLLPPALLAGAGLVLLHPRAALFLAALVLAVAIARGLEGRARPRALLIPAGAHLGLGFAAALVLSPWLVRLLVAPLAVGIAAPVPGAGEPTPMLLGAGFPGLVDRLLLVGAALGALVGLVGRWHGVLVVVLWLALALLAANLRLLGVPLDLMLTNDALGIALFLPVAVLNGCLVVAGARRLWPQRMPSPVRALAAALLLGVGIAGGANLAGLVNPVCLLATAADREALLWVREHTPSEARFAVNSRLWQRDVYAGTDAGYWLTAFAGRATTLPPLVYAEGGQGERTRVKSLAEAVAHGPRDDPRAYRDFLTAEGIDYLFVGGLGGPLHAPDFRGEDGYRLVYTNGRAWVFAVAPD